MKKLMITAVMAMSLGFTSCGSDDVAEALGLGCVTLGTDLVTAQQKYSDDPSSANCTEFKAAIEAYKTEACEGSADYDDELAALDCTAA